jgi:hypothetical protein
MSLLSHCDDDNIKTKSDEIGDAIHTWAQFQILLRVFYDEILLKSTIKDVVKIEVAERFLDFKDSDANEFILKNQPRLKKLIPWLVSRIIDRNGRLIRYLPDVYANDRRIALNAVQQNGFAYKHLCFSLKMDREIVYTALRTNGLALRFVLDEYMNDEDVVLVAVSQNGLALMHAPAVMQDNKKVVMTALRQHVACYEYASMRLRDDPDIIYELLRLDGTMLDWVNKNAVENYDELQQMATKQIARAKRQKLQDECEYIANIDIYPIKNCFV